MKDEIKTWKICGTGSNKLQKENDNSKAAVIYGYYSNNSRYGRKAIEKYNYTPNRTEEDEYGNKYSEN